MQKGVCVPTPGIARVGCFFEGAEAFVDFGCGDSLSEIGRGNLGGLLAEGKQVKPFLFCRWGGVEFL